jgi:hypothetical protein
VKRGMHLERKMLSRFLSNSDLELIFYVLLALTLVYHFINTLSYRLKLVGKGSKTDIWYSLSTVLTRF